MQDRSSWLVEDGALEVEGISIGAGCSLGVNAFVHYGVTMEDSAVLEAEDHDWLTDQPAPPA